VTFVDHYANESSSDKPGESAGDVVSEFNPSAEFHVNEGPRDIALVFIGDAYVAGYGDPKGLGWVSRVVARTAHADVDITAYQLGVRDETSADVLARWRIECPPRWKGRSEKRLVVSVGHSDAVNGMSTARVRLNLANILDDAAASGVAVFAVGPPPTLDADLNARLEIVVEAQADVCARRGVAYVNCVRRRLPRPGRLWADRVAGAARRLGPVDGPRSLKARLS
jgi:acyl-CoA thioesterase-1